MEKLLYLLPTLGCGLMMGACMYLMARGMRSHQQQSPTDADEAGEVATLREEVARLRAERQGERAHG